MSTLEEKLGIVKVRPGIVFATLKLLSHRIDGRSDGRPNIIQNVYHRII